MTTRRPVGVPVCGFVRTRTHAARGDGGPRQPRRGARPAAPPAAEPLEGRVLLADTLGLLKDINDASIGPNPGGLHQARSDGNHRFEDFTPVAGKVFFTAWRTPVGRELWVTDGTQAGTRLVKDIYPGLSSSVPRNLADVNGTLHFYADDGVHGVREWRSDGTEAGTVMIEAAAVAPPAVLAASAGVEPAGLPGMREGDTVINGRTYFNVISAETGTNPYVSDGTDEGTVMLIDPTPNPPDPWENQMRPAPRFLPVAGGKVVFPANTFTHTFVFNPNSPRGYTITVKHDLFVTDGTPAGTHLLETVPQVPPMSVQTKDSVYTDLVESGGTLYFGAVGPDQRDGLWRTDGTAGGTAMVSDGVGSLRRLMDLNGTVIFFGTGRDGVSGLWRSDGTAAGTARLAAMPLPANEPGPWWDVYRAVAGDTLYFSNAGTLWKTDGTAGGTVALRTFEPIPNDTADPSFLTPVGGTLYFYAPTAEFGDELWKTDGTPAGTVMVKDINPGPGSSTPNSEMASANGLLVFTAFHPTTGKEVWRSDGTDAGTFRLTDISPSTEFYGYAPGHLTAVGGRVYFEHHDGSFWRLYKTDGTAAGTVKLHGTDINNPVRFFTHDGKLFFIARPASYDDPRNLYVLDPATDALTLLRAALDVSYQRPASLGGAAYFISQDALWRTDGTPAGTYLVHDPEAPPNHAVEWLSPVAGADRVVVPLYTARYGLEPWVVGDDGGGPPPRAEVVGRHVFYNHSEFDDDNARADEDDDGAIATDKRPLLPGTVVATFENVTSYSRGINGVMIDVRGLSAAALAALSSDDFLLLSGPSPRELFVYAGPATISVRRGDGVGGSDRISLTWPDHNPASGSPANQAVANGWLQVRMLANDDTGLAEPDVFSFGNLIGETGDPAASAGAVVNALDVAAVKRNLTTAEVPITNPYDFNKDGRVNALDLAVVKSNLARRLAMSSVPVPLSAPPPPAETTAGSGATATSWLRSGG